MNIKTVAIFLAFILLAAITGWIVGEVHGGSIGPALWAIIAMGMAVMLWIGLHTNIGQEPDHIEAMLNGQKMSPRDEAVWCWATIILLTEEEGREIQITHPNPNFNGPNYCIDLEVDFGEESGGTTITGIGETRVDCLVSIQKQLKIREGKA